MTAHSIVGFDEEQMKIIQSYRRDEMRYKEKIELLRAEVATLKAALSKSDPIHRVYDGTLPVLECVHCGGRRGRFENEVQHTGDCVWVKSKE
jgi:hypothetical protein